MIIFFKRSVSSLLLSHVFVELYIVLSFKGSRHISDRFSIITTKFNLYLQNRNDRYVATESSSLASSVTAVGKKTAKIPVVIQCPDILSLMKNHAL